MRARFQPFGTSSLQETLVPGFGRDVGTKARNLGRQPHAPVRALGHQRAPLRVDARQRRAGEREPRRRLCAPGRAAGCHDRSPRRRVSADLHARAVQHVRRSDVIRLSRQPAFRAVRQRHASTEARIGSKWAATTFICSSDPSNRTTREVRSPTPGSSAGTRLRISCSAIRRSAVAGIGRGDQDGRTNWLHLFAQDDWRIRRNLTVNVGLRYEYNQHMRDENNRLSSVDYVTPGGRFVIASDENGNINPEAAALLPLMPIPYVTSAAGRVGSRPAESQQSAPGPANGIRLVARRRSRGRPRRLRHLPESVGLQRADRLLTQPAVLLHETGGCSCRPACARLSDAQHPHQRSHGRRGAEHHGPRVRRRVHADVERRSAVPAAAVDDGGSVVHGIVDARRRQRDRPQCPGAGTGIDPGAPPDSAAGRHPVDSVRRQVHLPRRDVQGGAAPAQQLLRTTSATRSRRRRTMRRVRDRPKPRRTSRRTSATSSTRPASGRHSSFDHRHLFVASGTYQLPFFAGAGGLQEALLGGWRVNAVFFAQSGAPFTVNLGVDQANIGAGPSQRPDQLRDPNLPATRAHARAVVRHVGVCAAGAVHLRERAAQ